MGVSDILHDVDNDVKSFFQKVASDWKKAKAAWKIISDPQTRALLITIGSGAMKAVRDAEAAVAAKGLSITLDAVVVADIKALLADAASGDGVILADLKALGL